MIIIIITSATTTTTVIEHLLYAAYVLQSYFIPHNNPVEFVWLFPFLRSENWAINGLTILLKIKQAAEAELGL